MENILDIKYRRQCRNAEHYYLYSSLLAEVTEEFAEKYNIKAFRSAYADAFAKENDAYLQNRAYKGTSTIDTKNTVCYRQFRAFNLIVNSKQLGDNPEEIKAANAILYLLKPYNKVIRKPLTESIAIMKDLVDALESEEYMAHIETLNITKEFEALKKASNEFELAYNVRSNEKLARTTMLKMKETRPIVEQSFINLADAISSLYIIATYIDKDTEKKTELGQIIDRLNAIINEFHTTISRRLSLAKPKVPSNDDNLPVPEPDEENPSEPDEEEDDKPIEVT